MKDSLVKLKAIVLGNDEITYEVVNADSLSVKELDRLANIIAGRTVMFGNAHVVSKLMGKSTIEQGKTTVECVTPIGRMPDASLRYYPLNGTLKRLNVKEGDVVTFMVRKDDRFLPLTYGMLSERVSTPEDAYSVTSFHLERYMRPIARPTVKMVSGSPIRHSGTCITI